jgi:hypothetical protein
VPLPGPKIIVGENSRKVKICMVNESDSNSYDSDYSIELARELILGVLSLISIT